MKKKEIIPIAVRLLKNELKTDLNSTSLKKDKTSNYIINEKSKIKINIVARSDLILCGIPFIKSFIKEVLKELVFKNKFNDGDKVQKNRIIATIFGSSKKILAAERTMLNFLQNLCSISTTTSRLVSILKKNNTKLLDTRKTVTGLRMVQKYATHIGGAKNHRFGLYDDILIKDNHIRISGGIKKVYKIIRAQKIKNYKIECDNIYQVKECINQGAKYILLDNMKPNKISDSIKLGKNKKIIFEISGGVNLKNIHKYMRLNANYISSGFITQSPEPVDIGMDII